MDRVMLGPFVLDARIGRGGMAEVWRAHHVEDDVSVAVKVLTGERARRPRSVRQFRQEARAVARLDHPHVVGVHDVGEVPPEAAMALQGSLEVGAPYLVMDLLPGGSLWRYRGRLAWPDLRNLLVVLLDALAHAHARGVIHRDLKPSNVLLSPERRAVLSDFGLAHLSESDLHLRAGTPGYMAPEQFLDRWRDFGPWTDLYGFGCLVWTLCTGVAPFRREGWETTRDAHLHDPLPPLRPLQPMPEGFEAWLAALLEKDPSRRTQCAADAAWSLERLEPDDIAATDLQSFVEPDDSLDARQEPSTMSFGPPPLLRSRPGAAVGRRDEPPPPPPDWRGPRSLRRLHLRGSGLGLLGARALPTVGREGERDALWSALVAVHRLPLARVVTLEGPAGTGKSHLARWLAQRAHEVGAAHTMIAEHAGRSGNEAGLAGMLRTHFGTLGLDAAAVRERVAEVAASYGVLSIQDQRLLAGLAVEESGAVSTPQRIGALSRYLCGVGARRPVVLVLDDAQRATDALLFVRWLLRRRESEPTPALVVLVLQDEGLARHAPARELAKQIFASEGVDRIRVDPLSDDEQQQLVRELVGIEGELARRIAARTGGNPAFAVALVEDWVARHVLVRAEGGFRLREGADAALPDDLHALWVAHLEHALEGFPEPVWWALEVAAVMGPRVRTTEWQRICVGAGPEPRWEAVEALVARRLAATDPRGWRFVQGMARESLIRRAEEGGRLLRAHQLVLQHLERRANVDDQRMARHLMAAGRVSEALGRTMHAARALFAAGNAHGALDLCDQAERALVDGGDELARRWRPPIGIQRARALVLLGRMDEAMSCAEAVVADPEATSVEVADASIVVATLAILRGKLEQARDQLSSIARQCEVAGHALQRARALRSLGIALHHLGDLEGAVAAASSARDASSQVREWPTWAEATLQLASTLVEMGRYEQGIAVADEALEVRERIPHPVAVAGLLNLRAEVERRHERYDRAVPLYEEALDILDRMGSLEAVLPRLNLAAVHVVNGRFGEAWRLAERCRRESTLQGRPPLDLAVRIVLLVAAIGLADRAGWEQQVVRIVEMSRSGVTTESDAYLLLGLAIRMLRARQEHLPADALTEVVARWAAGRGRVPTDPALAELLAEARR
ncbi:MAG: protein kinase [Alphaproteobacteria bacterium]|nr:protein kinase [Alphaproteobacteria bacterium]MCB9684305.1 protein kinase [Alphaproteobacteria bacterium]